MTETNKTMNERTIKLLRAYHNEYCSAVFPDDPNKALDEILSRMDDYIEGYFLSGYGPKDRPGLNVRTRWIK
jgi:hypothetical protein